MSHILALDPSSKMGWARWRPGMDAPVSGCKLLDAKRLGTRAHEAREWLRITIISNDIDLVVRETRLVSMGQTNAFADPWLYYLQIMIEEVAHALGVPVEDAPVQSWRKVFLGAAVAPKHIVKDRRRNWWKRQAIARCGELGWPVKTDDEAEACGILYWIRCQHDPQFAANSIGLFARAH